MSLLLATVSKVSATSGIHQTYVVKSHPGDVTCNYVDEIDKENPLQETDDLSELWGVQSSTS